MRNSEKRRGRLFLLEVLDKEKPDALPRIGFTVTKKVGNAAVRNRVRRRLKEAVRQNAAADMRPGHDYVMVGRREVLQAGWPMLCAEIKRRVKAKS